MKGAIVVDTLETVWYRQRFELDEEITPEEFLKAVEEGEISSIDGEYLLDTSSQVTSEDNDGDATLEIFAQTAETKNLIYSNATK